MNKFNPIDYPICFQIPPLVLPGPWVEHIPFALLLPQITNPAIFVELGAYRGNSYCSFCESVKLNQLQTRCYAIDNWEGDPHGGFYMDSVYEELKLFHDPRYGAFSELIKTNFDEAVTLFDDGSIDLLHIDGFHTYDAVKHDFDTWKDKLSEKAVVLFHDTAIKEKDFGVWKFWETTKDLYPSFEFHHGNGLGVLGVGSQYPETMDMLFFDYQNAGAIREFFQILGARLVYKLQQDQLEQKDAQIKLLDNEIRFYKDSKSWQITKPLRSFAKIFQSRD